MGVEEKLKFSSYDDPPPSPFPTQGVPGESSVWFCRRRRRRRREGGSVGLGIEKGGGEGDEI